MDYKTDLRQFFQAMQCRKDKRKLSELFKQEEFQSLGRDVQQMIAVHLNIRELKQKVVEEEEEMCQAYEELKEDWLEEGRQAGKLEGKLEAQCEMIQQTIQAFDITAEQAMGVLKVSDEVKEFYYKKYTNSSEI